jgi:glycine/D-amino acid oxidase-like deaminating enzyme
MSLCTATVIRSTKVRQQRLLHSCSTTTTSSRSRCYTQQYQDRRLQQQHVSYFTTTATTTTSTTKGSTNNLKLSNITTNTNEIEVVVSSTTRTTTESIPKTKTTIPSFANIVIIGGGIIGTSVAYHCGQLQQQLLSSNKHYRSNDDSSNNNVLLLEQNTLTSGTTWHAAGLINTFGSMSSTSTYMRQYTKDLYQNILPNITNMNTGYMDIGFIELACDIDRLYYYRKVAAYNRYCGINVQEITPQQIQEFFPACSIQDVLAGFYVQSDGRTNPTDTTYALAKAAKMTNRVQIMEQTQVKRIITQRNVDQSLLSHVTGVELMDDTIIQCNVVINCAGMWSRQLGEANNIYCIPNQAAEHYYCITEPISHINPNCPIIEDSSKYVYIRPESGGLMLGLFEPMGAPWNANTNIPNDFAFGQIEPDWDRMVRDLVY